MQEKITIENEYIKVNGFWGKSEKITGKAPLVIFAENDQEDHSSEYADYLNELGILTFRFKTTTDFAEAKKKLLTVFDTLRVSEQVAGEYIVLAGSNQAGRYTGLVASQIGKSVKGLILLTPEFKPEDLEVMKKYQGATMIVNGTDDTENKLKDVAKIAHNIKNAQLLEIRGGKHEYSEQDIDRVEHLIGTFLRTELN